MKFHIRYLMTGLCLVFSVSSFAIPRLEERNIIPEHYSHRAPTPGPVLDKDLRPFYREIKRGSSVRIFIGNGAQFNASSITDRLAKELEKQAKQDGVALTGWSISGHSFSFQDHKNQNYQVDFGHERDQFIEALGDYPIVFYSGHSRYGRGPTFDEMSHYFRMGDAFSTIEVETRNPYFLQEEIQNQSEYPVEYVDLDGSSYPYQYIGQLDPSSYLADDSYTKIIEGGDKDLSAATFLSGKQILFFQSCRNEFYFKKPLRNRFAADDKFVFGTSEDSYGVLSVQARLILSIITEVSSSAEIVKKMNTYENVNTAY